MTQQNNPAQVDSLVRVRHMLGYSQEAVDTAQGYSRADLDTDRLLNLALTRLVELVGEAAWFVRNEFRVQHPHVPWRVIVGTRQRLTH